MYKYFCDLCKEEIQDFKSSSLFKFKKCNKWGEWERLLVHKSCWKKVTEYLKENK